VREREREREREKEKRDRGRKESNEIDEGSEEGSETYL
jgi:hypothetical protein